MNNGTDVISWSWVATTISVESLSKIVATLIVIAGALTALFPQVSFYYRVWKAARVLSKSQLEFTREPPAYVLPRQDVLDSLQGALNDSEYNTALVYGERGSGKTTAIEWNLRNRLGIVQWTLLSTTGPDITLELEGKWTREFSKWAKPEDRKFELTVCNFIKKYYKNPLVVIITIDADAGPTVLRSVVHFCKKYGYQTSRVRMIVDISSSRIAAAMNTSLTKLRLSGVYVGGISQPEANSLLMNRLPADWTPPLKQKISLEISNRIDCVLLTLVAVSRGLKSGMSVDAALAHVAESYETLYRSARRKLGDFDRCLRREIDNLHDGTTLTPPDLLQRDPYGLSDEGMEKLARMIGYAEVAAIMSEIGDPHIFAIDPFRGTFSLNGQIMKQAFIDHYKR